MLKKLLVVALIGGVVYQYPGVVGEVSNALGWNSGTACGATQGYFHALGEGDSAAADEYKFFGDSIKSWTSDLDNVTNVECTCTEDVSQGVLDSVQEIPDEVKQSINKTTEAKLVLFTLDAGYDGKPSTLKGGAMVFSALTPGWFVSQEGYYQIDGENTGSFNVGQLSTQCVGSEDGD